MTTTGTSLFNLDFTEIAEEAWERAGREMRSGYDLRTARRSMNLMTIEWQNRGINMWTIEPGSFNMVQGQFCYPLPVDTIDLMEQQIRTGANNYSTQSDLNITRISVSTYSTIPNKITQARPIQVMVQRMSGQSAPITGVLDGGITDSDTTITLTDVTGLPAFGFVQIGSEIINYSYIVQDPTGTGGTLNNCFRAQANTTAAAHLTGATVYWNQLPAVVVWPVPNQGTLAQPYYTFTYYRMRRVQDAGAGAETADMNFRFLPALTAGLAYYIAMKHPDLTERVQMLKAAYDEQFDLCAAEDREKAPIRFVPRFYRPT
jgi:hypothetical protein